MASTRYGYLLKMHETLAAWKKFPTKIEQEVVEYAPREETVVSAMVYWEKQPVIYINFDQPEVMLNDDLFKVIVKTAKKKNWLVRDVENAAGLMGKIYWKAYCDIVKKKMKLK